jgi:hypothetical protein
MVNCIKTLGGGEENMGDKGKKDLRKRKKQKIDKKDTKNR